MDSIAHACLRGEKYARRRWNNKLYEADYSISYLIGVLIQLTGQAMARRLYAMLPWQLLPAPAVQP